MTALPFNVLLSVAVLPEMLVLSVTTVGAVVSLTPLKCAAITELRDKRVFNPSLAPLQVALVAMALAKEDFSDIAEVVLAEAVNNSISQLGATKSVLAVIAPRAEFRLLPRAK